MEPFYRNTHILTEIDSANKTAICSVCGPVDVYARSDKATRRVPWKCGKQQRARSLERYLGVPKEQRIRAWAENSVRPRKAVMRQEKRRKFRLEVIAKFGGRCCNPKCSWVNADGSKGCTDVRCLQVDHVFAGGSRERIDYGNNRLYKKILLNEDGRYQLLCANCNWIKRIDSSEDIKHRVHRVEDLQRI